MFARSKSIDLNYSLILINTLNTRLPHNLITQSHGDCFREYIEINNDYFLILTSNENNLLYSSLKHQRGRQKHSFCNS